MKNQSLNRQKYCVVNGIMYDTPYDCDDSQDRAVHFTGQKRCFMSLIIRSH